MESFLEIHVCKNDPDFNISRFLLEDVIFFFSRYLSTLTLTYMMDTYDEKRVSIHISVPVINEEYQDIEKLREIGTNIINNEFYNRIIYLYETKNDKELINMKFFKKWDLLRVEKIKRIKSRL